MGNTTTVGLHARVAKTGPAVREALAGLDSSDCRRFEEEFQAALQATAADWDLGRIEALVGRWWAYVMDRLNPDPDADAAWARIKAGDESGITERWRARPDGSHDVYHKNANGGWEFSCHRPADGA